MIRSDSCYLKGLIYFAQFTNEVKFIVVREICTREITPVDDMIVVSITYLTIYIYLVLCYFALAEKSALILESNICYLLCLFKVMVRLYILGFAHKWFFAVSTHSVIRATMNQVKLSGSKSFFVGQGN